MTRQEVVYLSPADKYHRLAHRLLQEQTGLDERALIVPSGPRAPGDTLAAGRAEARRPGQGLSPGRWLPPCVLPHLLAVARAARDRAVLRAASRRERSGPPPSLASTAAPAGPSRYRWSVAPGGTAAGSGHAGGHRERTPETTPTAGARRGRPSTACCRVVRPRPHAA